MNMSWRYSAWNRVKQDEPLTILGKNERVNNHVLEYISFPDHVVDIFLDLLVRCLEKLPKYIIPNGVEKY